MADGEGDSKVGQGGARNFDKVGICLRNLHRAVPIWHSRVS
jgi:hypothetical protein